MNEVILAAAILISISILFYLLWINGYMVLSMKRAILFIGSLRQKNKCEVTFSSCSGYVKKVIKFKENQSYNFSLDCDISKGNIHITIENKNKEILLNLTPMVKTGLLTVDEKCRYYLVINFEKADGKLSLRWD